MSRHEFYIVWVCRHVIWYELEIKYVTVTILSRTAIPFSLLTALLCKSTS